MRDLQRVSTDAQERDGTSLDTQERACLALAEKNGWTVEGTVRDSASGFSLERSGLTEVRALAAKAIVGVVLSYSLDRLSRKQTHVAILVEEMEERGVSLQFVTENFEDTATGQLLRSVKAFAAEFEREKIAERTMRGKAQRARSGKLPQATGRDIYGYRYDPATGTRHVEPREATVVLEIFESFASSASCHGIAASLNSRGVPAFAGGQWYPLTIRRMLLNETYTGRSTYRRLKSEKYRDGRSGRWKVRVSERDEDEWIEVEGATPAIVSSPLFARVNAILSDPQRRSRAQPSRNYPLTGRLRCEHCGSPMVGQVLMKGRYSYYRCRGRYVGRASSSCPAKYIRTDTLESAVRSALQRVLSDPERIIAEARRINSVAPHHQQLAHVLASLKEVEARQRRLIRLFTEGELPTAILEEQRTELSTKRTALEVERQQLQSLGTQEIDIHRIQQNLPRVIQQIQEWVLTFGENGLSLMLNAFDAQMVASPARVQVKGNVPAIEAFRADDLATIERTSA